VQSEFRVEVREQDGAALIAISGELDLASAPALEETLDHALKSDVRLVILDLRDLEFMDSTGLSVLVRGHQAAEEAGRRLTLIQGPPQVKRLLNLTGVTERLIVVDSPEDARGTG
jgi:anti-sigma B factor antagonist